MGDSAVSLCDNSNLSNKGHPITRFLSRDGYHLSSQGVNMMAANIRDEIDNALDLPKRMQKTHDSQRSQGYMDNRFNERGRRGRFQFRGRGRGYWRK